MSHLRHLSIPLEHLIAEMAAYPLSSPASLTIGLRELSKWVARDQNTGQLWRAAETELLRKLPSFSVDELVAWRDRIWFTMPLDSREGDHEHPTVSLLSYLKQLAATQLRQRGSRAVPCLQWERLQRGGLDPEYYKKPISRDAWRWQSFALPEDLLLAALGSPQSIPCQVDTLAPQWQQHLADAGFVEPHLHLGAGIDFRLLWSGTMARIGSPDINPNWLASPGAEFDDGRQLAIWILHAALARFMLGAFLDSQAKSGTSWPQYLFGDLKGDSPTKESGALSLCRQQLGVINAILIRDALFALGNGTVGQGNAPNFRELQWLYRRLIANTVAGNRHVDRTLPARWQANCGDPMVEWFPYRSRNDVTPEMRFIAHGLEYLERHPKDDDFTQLFWQVIRVRCVFFRHLVLRPMTPGLQYFIRSYQRIGPPRAGLSDSVIIESVADLSGLGHGLRSLEIRTSPQSDVSSMIGFLNDVRKAFFDHAASRNPETIPSDGAAARRTGRRYESFDAACDACDSTSSKSSSNIAYPEFGVVFHFTKRRGGGWEEGRPNAFGARTFAEPNLGAAGVTRISSREPLTRYRFANFYASRLREAKAIGRMLLMYPLALSVLRGLDLCTDELGIPTWVFVSPLRYLRDLSCRVSEWLETEHDWEIPPLRNTVHVGEDFVHLLGGLRRIDEAIQFLGLREGDRLGHAIALGTEPKSWAKSAGQVNLPREERLWDLVWEWSQYTRDGIPYPAGRDLILEREIHRLSGQVFDIPGLSPWVLERAYELLHDEGIQGQLKYPHGVGQYFQPRRSRLGEHLKHHSHRDSDKSRSHQNSDARRSRETQRGDGLSLSMQCVQQALEDRETFLRGQVLETVHTENDAEALACLQQSLRKRVASHGLTVEINPSSNLLIGNLADMKSHPLWALNSPFADSNGDDIPVCIGSDDPLTFATHTRAEYMLVYATLIQNGLSVEATEAWLDRARMRGLQSRFTIPTRADWLQIRLQDLQAHINISGIIEPLGV